MDCEKFEAAMMDELYGELDELTSAAAKRHVSGCARCAGLLGGLRATRRMLATVPPVEPPPGLEERILTAAGDVPVPKPRRRGVGGTISWAATWAMRPQTAMAAIFLVMTCTSVLLLRNKPARAPGMGRFGASSEAAIPPVPTVSEIAPAASVAVVTHAAQPAAATPSAAPAEHVPHALNEAPAKPADEEAVTAAAAFAPAAAAVETASPASFDSALAAYQAGRFDEAAHGFDALAGSDPNAELWAARAVRDGKGCRSALARFDKVARRAPGTTPGWDAMLEGALCYRTIGNFGEARVRLMELLKVDSHKDKAQAELDRLPDPQESAGATAPPSGAAKASPKRAAPAANGR